MSGTKHIVGINSDIRLQSANQYEVPSYSMNHYVLGGLLTHGHLVRSFDEAVQLIKQLTKGE